VVPVPKPHMRTFLLLSLLSVLAYTELVLTPFGHRPSECVLEVPSGSTVIPGEDDLLIISTPALDDQPSQIKYYKAPRHCGDDIEAIREKRRAMRKTGPQLASSNVSETNGWLDYVGCYPPAGENNLRGFTSTYVVPENPGNANGKQVLFYFIGMQDNDNSSAVNILQPVLTWGNGYNRWYVKSWVCCPKNITVSSPPLFGLVAGSQVQGVISRESPSNWLIDSVFNGQHTTLNSQVGDYIYNWADVTLEVYYINDCTDLAKGKAYFNALVLTDAQGQALNPKWQKYSGATLCGGSIVAASANSYYIEHTQAK